MIQQPGIDADNDALAGALSRWENEGGSAASDWKPRVAPARRVEQPLHSSTAFRLIKAAPLNRDAVVLAFESLATKIQNRDRCFRVEALQRAVNENPEPFAAYCRAMAR